MARLILFVALWSESVRNAPLPEPWPAGRPASYVTSTEWDARGRIVRLEACGPLEALPPLPGPLGGAPTAPGAVTRRVSLHVVWPIPVAPKARTRRVGPVAWRETAR